MTGSRISHAKPNVSHRLAYAIEIIEGVESAISRNRLFSKVYFQFRFAGFLVGPCSGAIDLKNPGPTNLVLKTNNIFHPSDQDIVGLLFVPIYRIEPSQPT